MESLPRNAEIETSPEMSFAPPMVDLLKDAEAAAELWPEYAEQLTPQIEQHQRVAGVINQYLDHFYDTESTSLETKQNYWRATSELLQNPESERIALFLPFESFPSPEDDSVAAEGFRQDYLEAWQNLLCVQDVRANFNDGDVLEVAARPGDPERVVKAAHLAPFLIQNQMITTEDVLTIMESGAGEMICRGFLDTVPMMQDWGQISASEQARFDKIRQDLPEPPKPAEPKFISEKRKAWLAEKANPLPRPTEFTEDYIKLGLPLSSRIENLAPEIETAGQVAAVLDTKKTTGVIMLGGSRLKGYGRSDSDLDLYVITEDRDAPQMEGVHNIPYQNLLEQPFEYAHEFFDTLMVGDLEKIKVLQRELAPVYFSEDDGQMRRWNTEKLEQDLLEYRLLQKGYPRLCPDTNPEYKKYIQMDGRSVFYETGFRVIAAKIYANSVFIPKVNK